MHRDIKLNLSLDFWNYIHPSGCFQSLRIKYRTCNSFSFQYLKDYYYHGSRIIVPCYHIVYIKSIKKIAFDKKIHSSHIYIDELTPLWFFQKIFVTFNIIISQTFLKISLKVLNSFRRYENFLLQY